MPKEFKRKVLSEEKKGSILDVLAEGNREEIIKDRGKLHFEYIIMINMAK